MKNFLFSLLSLLIITAKLSAQSSLTVGQPVPEITITDWIANVPADQSLENKFLVVDFWATWCGPCIASVPHFNELQASAGERKDVLFLSMTYESPEKVKKMLKRVNFETPVVTDQQKATQERFQIRSIPSTWVIGPNKQLLWQGHPNQLSKRKLEKLITSPKIEKLVATTQETTAESPGQKVKTETVTVQELLTKALHDTSYIADFKWAEVPDEAGFQANFMPIGLYVAGKDLRTILSGLMKKSKNSILLPVDLENNYYRLFYLDKRIQETAAAHASAVENILHKNEWVIDTVRKIRPVYQFSVKDGTLLQPETDAEATGAISEAKEQVIISNQPISAMLFYLENTLGIHLEDYTDLDGRYNFILDNQSKEAAFKSLSSYGLDFSIKDKEVDLYQLRLARP